MRRMHANASLPRSGSELLQALLGQHPEVFASATSPLLDYVYGAQSNATDPATLAQPRESAHGAFTGFARAGCIGYYEAQTECPVVVDKSRGWLEYAELLWRMFPAAKIISMIRPTEQILESMDRAYLRNLGHPETRNIPRSRSERFEYWLRLDCLPLGLALSRLRARRELGPDPRIRYLQYEDLVKNPVDVMRQVFAHLELPAIEVNHQNVIKSAAEHDAVFGIYGRHHVRQTVCKE